MRQIRTGVFETNSSSTHSICISTERSLPLDYPSVVHFSCKHFGWKEAKLDSPDEKASYLYASILDLFSQRDAEKSKTRFTSIFLRRALYANLMNPSTIRTAGCALSTTLALTMPETMNTWIL